MQNPTLIINFDSYFEKNKKSLKRSTKKVLPLYIMQSNTNTHIKSVIKTQLLDALSKYENEDFTYLLEILFIIPKSDKKNNITLNSLEKENFKKIINDFDMFKTNLNNFNKELFKNNNIKIYSYLNKYIKLFNKFEQSSKTIVDFAKETEQNNFVFDHEIENYITLYIDYLKENSLLKQNIFVKPDSYKIINIKKGLSESFFKEEGIYINTSRELCVNILNQIKSQEKNTSKKTKKLIKNND